MKQFSAYLNAVLVFALVFILLFSILPHARAETTSIPQPSGAAQSVPEPACDNSRSISVSGTAVVNVPPDRVLIQLGVQSNGKTADLVQAANTGKIGQMVRAIKKLGVDASDITQDWYLIEPLYEDYDSLRIKGYRINNTVAITLREVNKTNAVITAALQAGANQVIDVELYTSELRKYRDQAREMAMQAAAEKAQALAGAAGARIGCVLNISENTWSYYNGWRWGYGSNPVQNVWTQNVSQNVAPSSAQEGALSENGPVSLGLISVKAEVGATFGLK
jgi:uncharacterized protein YggE